MLERDGIPLFEWIVRKGILQRADNPDHGGLCPVGQKLPVSINEAEANYLHDFIVRHKLTRGLDLATGTGVSASVMGMAMARTLGGVITVDSQDEEIQQAQITDRRTLKPHQELTITPLKLWNALDDTEPRPVPPLSIVGKWPDVCSQFGVLDEERGWTFDVVMLDCPKCDADLSEDLAAIVQRLSRRKFALFIHDTHVMLSSKSLVWNCLGVELVNVLPSQKYPFMLATNLPI